MTKEDEIEFVDDSWQLEQYQKAGNNYIAWILTADSLIIASRFLKNHRDTFDIKSLKVGDIVPDEDKILAPELMLRGFAIECLMKALYVKAGGEICVNGKYQGIKGIKGAQNHDLLKLADVNNLSFSKKKCSILKRLSIFTAIGRYPIPRNYNATKIQWMPDDRENSPISWISPSYDNLVDSILEELYKRLES